MVCRRMNLFSAAFNLNEEGFSMTKRKLTITYQYYPSNKVIPVLRVQGCWFEKLGFKVGDEVEVYQGKQDELIIRKVSNGERYE